MDRESAFEKLRKRADDAEAEAERLEREAEEAEAREEAEAERKREFQKARRYDGGSTRKTTTRKSSSRSDSAGTAFAKSLARQLGTRAGQTLIRGVPGSLFKGR